MTYTRPAHGDPGNNSSATDATVIIDALSDGLEALESDGPTIKATANGVRMNGGAVWLGTASSASTTFSCTNAGYYSQDFKASDVGATIRISPQDYATATVTRTITAVAGDGKSVTLSSAPGFTSILCYAEWSHDTDAEITANTTALQALIDSADGRVIEFPPGTAIFDGTLLMREGTRLRGAGYAFLNNQSGTAPSSADQASYSTTLILKRGVDEIFFYAGAFHNGVGFTDIQIIGNSEPSTTNSTIELVSTASNYAIAPKFDNARIVGGYHSLHAVWFGVGIVNGGIFGGCRHHAVYLYQSPDWTFTSSDAIAHINTAKTGSAFYCDTGSDHTIFTGGYAEFSEYGVYLGSSGNIVTGMRVTDNYKAGIVVAGNRNTVVGCGVLGIQGQTTGWTSGVDSGIYITGNNNTVMGNTTEDPNGRMAYGTNLAGTADGNVVIPGASSGSHANTASGTNVVITS